MSNTYSRYVADTKGSIDVLFAKWQILVNSHDITNNTNSTITIVPVIEENDHIASNVMAPTSKGYFDIEIDPTNVDVSFRYAINLEMENENIPDLLITKYAILPDSYVEGASLDTTNLTGTVITNTLVFDKNTPSFKFNAFTIRIFFEWYNGDGRTMTDEEDTEIGASDETFKINTNISFEQYL